MFQIIDLQVSEKDIEKEHHAQLRRWKEMHGDLHCKSPPRMHGAKAIMSAEPPTRQDLRQRPTIIVESPLASKTGEERAENAEASRTTVKEKRKETNQHLPATDPSPFLQPDTRGGSKESLSSAEHDTYL